MKEFITFIITILFSILLVCSLPQLKRWFSKIEIFLLLLFTSYFCQNMFYAISSPYPRITVVEKHIPFWTVRFQYGVIFAITLIWVIAVYRSEATLMKKLVVTFSWIIFGILVEKAFLLLGVLTSESKSWYPSLDMFFEMLVILITYWFSNFLHQTLKRERIL